MTVTYSPRELLVFSHLKGTVLPEVWRMCAFTCALAYALCHIYNPIRRTVRDGGPKTILYYIFHDCDAFFGLCTSFVTFILSFFNATIFGRWWKMRELCGTVNGRTVDTCVLLSAYIKDQEKLDDMLRLLWLAHALHVHSVIPSSHAGLLTLIPNPNPNPNPDLNPNPNPNPNQPPRPHGGDLLSHPLLLLLREREVVRYTALLS